MRRRITVAVLTAVALLGGGLVVLAVERVQHAATRSQCINNLKQIGLGLHNYEGTYGYLPSGSVSSGKLSCERRLSWFVHLIPFVDQLRIVVDPSQPWDAEENRRPRWRDGGDIGQEIEKELGEYKLFCCPANPNRGGPDSASFTHYVGIAGVGPGAAEWGPHYPGIGVFGCERRTRFEDITDGLATTLMVSETARANGPWTAGGPATVRGLDPTGGPYLGAAGQFSSAHRYSPNVFVTRLPVATNVLFADCSVRSFSEAVSPQVFEALATIAGGEDVAAPEDH